jgi:hypothetical protein
VGDIEKRLDDLERRFANEAEETSPEEKRQWKFTVDALDAMAHVRREEIDSPPWRYTLAKLRDFDPFQVAAYAAALTTLGHPDEADAREILDEALEGQDDTELRRLMEIFAEIPRRRDYHGL